MTTRPLADDHWRTCLISPYLRAPGDAGAAAFFVRTYARDLVFPGFVSIDEARPVVRRYAEVVGLDEGSADGVLAEVVDARIVETAAGPGAEVPFAVALAQLRDQGVAVRVGLDCCRDRALERVERDHGDHDRTFAVAAIDDLMKIARASRIDVSFSYLDSAMVDVLTPELNARAAAGDREAQATWLRAVDDAERVAGGLVASAMRDVAGLDVTWNGTAQDTVGVHVPGWSRPLPV
ncbi:hypothetical protein ASF83_13690 [Plantibacter sp. Leaf171]|uniref:hypothetical protein n=1 Tax=unclassified Plantibacter TaxID=2624265 RepID=UPI0006F32525|nr:MULTISPECIES: hypothetical protein [unclassified Plantibacter]KQM16811.1 hypothetical protein ASE44_13700 [Plantibacter sp. Leaf1]KQR59947.1 hypothetical protein ASF83_13690 [Plantibacter sp. Leaf171]